jgi:hypothetical protein
MALSCRITTRVPCNQNESIVEGERGDTVATPWQEGQFTMVTFSFRVIFPYSLFAFKLQPERTACSGDRLEAIALMSNSLLKPLVQSCLLASEYLTSYMAGNPRAVLRYRSLCPHSLQAYLPLRYVIKRNRSKSGIQAI